MDWGDHFAKLSLKHAAVGIILLDEQGVVRFVNTQAESFFGMPSAKMEGMHIHNLAHGAPPAQRTHRRLGCQLLDLIGKNKSALRQSDVFWRNHLPFWVEYSIYPLIDEAGTKSFLLSFLDAEVAFRGKKKYLQSRAKYRIVFEMSHDAKVILSSTGTIEEANQAALKFFEKDGLIHENFFELFPKEGKAKLKELWKERHKRKIRLTLLEFIRDTNEELFIEITIIPDVLPEETLVIFRDTTAIIMEQRQRDRFLALVGHELKTPLAVIKAFTQLLQSTTKNLSDPKVDRYLHHINEKTDLLTGLINGMMDAIHLGSGRLQFQDEKIEFDQLTDEIVFESKKMFPKRLIHLKGLTKSQVLLDKQRVTQVITNLIVNAVKYSPSDSIVEIVRSRSNDMVTFSVTDAGSGIPKTEQTKLFLPFFRGRRARSSGTQGLGLGLYLARQVIQHYKGRLTVQSAYGKGSTFTIFLHPSDAESVK